MEIHICKNKCTDRLGDLRKWVGERAPLLRSVTGHASTQSGLGYVLPVPLYPLFPWTKSRNKHNCKIVCARLYAASMSYKN